MPAPGEHSLIDIVDSGDQVIGTMERAETIESGLGFRVAHIFVFNSSGNLLLGQLGRVRTRDPGRWGSSVAAHLHAGESYEAAAQRRLQEELEISSPVTFVDKVKMDDRGSLKFIGFFEASSNEANNAEPDHIGGLEFRSLDWITNAISQHPDDFTETFRILFDRYCEINDRTS